MVLDPGGLKSALRWSSWFAKIVLGGGRHSGKLQYWGEQECTLMLTNWHICDQKEGELAGKQVVAPVIGYPSQGGNLLPKKTFLVTVTPISRGRGASFTKDEFRVIVPPMSTIPPMEVISHHRIFVTVRLQRCIGAIASLDWLISHRKTSLAIILYLKNIGK